MSRTSDKRRNNTRRGKRHISTTHRGASITDISKPYQRADDGARDDEIAARVAAAKAEARRRAES